MPPDLAEPAGFLAPAAVRARLAEILEPPADLTVTEAAEESRTLYNPGGGYSGPYRRALAPYCAAPQDSLKDSLYRTTVFVAPGQCGKTEILLNWAHYSVVYDPADMLLVLDEKDQADDFVDRRVKRWVQYNDCVAERLVEDKRFTRSFTGMLLTVLWATGSKAASKPAPRIALDERDSMSDDLDGEGDPYELFAKRAETFGDAAKIYVSSSPKKPIRRARRDPGSGSGAGDRRALGPHEAPPTTGILALYNRGTRKRLYWPCPSCGAWHTPTFDMLRWPEEVTAADRDYPVTLECPENGCVIEEAAKPAMLAAARWVAEGQTIGEDGTVTGEARPSAIDSYWLRGPSNAFMSWSALVAKYLDALLEFEDTGSDAKLKTFWQLEEAAPYTPPEGEDEIRFDGDAIAARAEPYPLGIVPAAARFLTAAIDVQGNRFEIEIRAWGVGLESWVVQRFAVFKADDPDAPGGERLLDPANRAADWDLLFDRVLASRWPVEGGSSDGRPGAPAGPGGLSVSIACTAIDAFGADGVTTQAYDFWRRARARGFGKYRLILTRGSPRPDAPLLAWSTPERAGGKRPKGGGGYAELHTVNVSALKDVVARRLALEEPGPLFLHFAEGLRDLPGIDFFAELTAEAKIDDKWTRLRARNEALDHLVMGIATTLHLRANRIDWARPPLWARPWPGNANARAGGAPAAPAGTDAPLPAAPPPPAAPRPRAPAGNPFMRRGRRTAF